MKAVIFIPTIMSFLFLFSCSNEKETNRYAKLTAGVLLESSRFSISPNKEELLITIREKNYEKAWAYLYDLKNLSLIDTSFVSDIGFIRWGQDTIIYEEGGLHRKMAHSSKKSIGNYRIRYDKDSLRTPARSWTDHEIYVFDRYEIDIENEELRFFEKDSTNFTQIELKDFFKDCRNFSKVEVINDMPIEKYYIDGYFENIHATNDYRLNPSELQLFQEFHRDLFRKLKEFHN